MTDADLVLGKLDPDNFAGGSISCIPISQSRVVEPCGRHAGYGRVEAAFGVAEVVDENMANAARVHAVENGEDLSEYTMIAFGGAAPLHAGRLCEKLGCGSLLVPPGAGVGSAIGFLRAPFSFEANRSVYMKLSDFDRRTDQDCSDRAGSRGDRVRAHLRCSQPHPVRIQSLHALYRAGLGNPDDLTEEQAMNPDAATFEARFIEDYPKLFGRLWSRDGYRDHGLVGERHDAHQKTLREDETDGSDSRAICGARLCLTAAQATILMQPSSIV